MHAATDIAQFLLALNINRGFKMTLEDCRRFLFPYKKNTHRIPHIYEYPFSEEKHDLRIWWLIDIQQIIEW